MANRQRIYVFPNRAGFVAFALFLIMLATAATYQNNMIFSMSFFVLSLALVAILQTARNVRDLRVLAVHLQSNFATSVTSGAVTLINPARDTKFNISGYAEFRGGLRTTRFRAPFNSVHVAKQSSHTFQIQTRLPVSRGRYQLHRLCITSQAPYGLFQAWIYLHVASEVIVYPKTAGSSELPIAHASQGEDFSGHKKFAMGDAVNRIDWKVYSRRRELFVREFREGSAEQVDLLLTDNSKDLEPELSQLALWIREAYRRQYDFRLSTKINNTGFGQNEAHFHRCLSELALWKG
jgi:uncharacterized protein (DUF58 family)